MSMHWEGGSDEFNSVKYKTCSKCGEIIFMNPGGDGTCICEKEIIEKRNQIIDSLLQKKWYEFWK